MALWLARDKTQPQRYHIFFDTPVLVNGRYNTYKDIPPDAIEKIANVALKPGECRKIESIKIELK